MRKFVVVGHPGSGADELKGVASLHPDLRFHGELFSPYRQQREQCAVMVGGNPVVYDGPEEDAFEFLERTIWSNEYSSAVAVGFTLLTERLDVAGTKRFYARLKEEHPDCFVVHVKRRNLFDAYCAHQEQLAQMFSTASEASNIGVSTGVQLQGAEGASALQQLFEEKISMTNFFASHFGGPHYLEIDWEEFHSQSRREIDKLFNFLLLSPLKLDFSIQAKLAPQRPPVVSDYQELVKRFISTRFASYFRNSTEDPTPSAGTHTIVIRSSNEFSISGINFVDPGHDRSLKTTADRVVILKSAAMLQWYVNLFGSRGIRNVLEFGTWQGGSPLALTAMLNLNKFVGIDIGPTIPQVARAIERSGLDSIISLHYETSQSDRSKVSQIIKEHFSNRSLDMIIDDASHSYNHTLASFEISFPALIPGGCYVIEDWGWLHWNGFEHYAADRASEKSMSAIIFELSMASASAPNVIESVTVYPSFVIVQKAAGANSLDAENFSLEKLIRIHGSNPLAV